MFLLLTKQIQHTIYTWSPRAFNQVIIVSFSKLLLFNRTHVRLHYIIELWTFLFGVGFPLQSLVISYRSKPLLLIVLLKENDFPQLLVGESIIKKQYKSAKGGILIKMIDKWKVINNYDLNNDPNNRENHFGNNRPTQCLKRGPIWIPKWCLHWHSGVEFCIKDYKRSKSLQQMATSKKAGCHHFQYCNTIVYFIILSMPGKQPSLSNKLGSLFQT